MVCCRGLTPTKDEKGDNPYEAQDCCNCRCRSGTGCRHDRLRRCCLYRCILHRILTASSAAASSEASSSEVASSEVEATSAEYTVYNTTGSKVTELYLYDAGSEDKGENLAGGGSG